MKDQSILRQIADVEQRIQTLQQDTQTALPAQAATLRQSFVIIDAALAHIRETVGATPEPDLRAVAQDDAPITPAPRAVNDAPTPADDECDRLFKALILEQAYLHAVLQHIPSGLALAEVPSGKLLLHNAEAVRLLRHPMLGTNDYRDYEQYGALHPDGTSYQPSEYPIARAVLYNAVIQQEEMLYRRGDGTLTTFAVNAAPVYTPDGRLVAAVSTFHDIAHRKRLEQTLAFLAEAGTILATSFDYQTTLRRVAQLAVPVVADWCAIHIRAANGAPTPLVVAHSDPAKAARGLALAEHLPYDSSTPSGIAQVLHTRQPLLVADCSEELLDAVVADPEQRQILHSFKLRSYMIIPLVVRDQALGTIAFAMAETERQYTSTDLVHAEALAQRAALAIDNASLYQEAQEAVREREALLSVASHELKNPLTSLIGYTQLLIRRAMPGAIMTEREQRAIATIAEQSARLNRMLDALLDTARLESGQFRLQRQPVNLHQLLTRVIDDLQPTLEQHQIAYAAASAEALVMGDELRLEQVVRNLLANAVKYTPAGGRIDVQLEIDSANVCFNVRDPGIGIPAASLPHIFRRFYRAQERNASVIGGLGLGLYVVKEIVALHGGNIDVTSAEGAGSTFVICLPRQTHEAVPQARTAG